LKSKHFEGEHKVSNHWKIGLILLFIIFCLSHLTDIASANFGRPPLSTTGAPGEISCANCHSGSVNSSRGSINMAGLPRDYKPGETYALRVMLQDETASRWGFQLTATNERGQTVGKFSLTHDTITELRDGIVNNNARQYIGPTFAGNFSNQTGMVEWDFNWTAPSQGTVTFYISGVAADRDGSERGDHVYTTTLTTRLEQFGAPILNFVSPNKGSAAGGTMVLLGGDNYQPGIQVFFDTLPAQITVRNRNTIEAITPPHNPGLVDVRIVDINGKAETFSDVFTYTPLPPPAPKVAEVNPNLANTLGGTLITIRGSNFTSDSQLIIDRQPVASNFLESTTLVANAPLHAPGAVNITVINADGQAATLENGLIYEGEQPPPVIKLLQPRSSTLSAGGASATIKWSLESAGNVQQSLLLSTDGGLTFPLTIARNLPASVTSFVWAIPEDITGENVKIRLQVTQQQQIVHDDTDSLKIVAAPQIMLITPATARVGREKLIAEIQGKNFIPGAIVEMDGVRLKATITPTTIRLKKVPHATIGGQFITVRNPNGGVSRKYLFTVSTN
jgi:hypothetical protein